MSDLPPYPDTDDDGGERGSAAGTPRRYLLGIIIAIVLALLFVVLHLTGTLGPGDH